MGNVITVDIYGLRNWFTVRLLSLAWQDKRVVHVHVLYFIDLRQPGLVTIISARISPRRSTLPRKPSGL